MGSNATRSGIAGGFSIGIKNVVGFNPQKIERHYYLCGSKSIEIMENVYKEYQTILDRIGENWSSPEAVTFCESLVSEMNTGINKTCQELIDVMNKIQSAVSKWSIATKCNVYLPTMAEDIRKAAKQVQSKAQSSIMGVVGVNIQGLEAPALYNFYKEEVENACSGFCANIRELDFKGYEQQPALEMKVQLLTRNFKANVDTTLDKIYKKAKEVAQQHRETAEQVKNTFQN